MTTTRVRIEGGTGRTAPARIEYLRVWNYRALCDVELKGIAPLTVMLGPNGSGKSTVFDVFNFLSECFQYGLRHAWDRRGRGRELKTRGQPEAGPQERLSKTGDNLPNVVQYLKEQHPDRLETIFETLRRRVPRLERVEAEPMPDGRLLLRIKDAPFERPVMSRFASDGTLKMLSYLVVLLDPKPPRFVGIEEPENFLHPRLLPELAEECRAASDNSQLLVTTHSPFFLNGIRPEEVRVIYRDEEGYSHVRRAADVQGIPEFVEAGASMGHLWLEGRFGLGDPLVNAGAPTKKGGKG